MPGTCNCVAPLEKLPHPSQTDEIRRAAVPHDRADKLSQSGGPREIWWRHLESRPADHINGQALRWSNEMSAAVVD